MLGLTLYISALGVGFVSPLLPRTGLSCLVTFWPMCKENGVAAEEVFRGRLPTFPIFTTFSQRSKCLPNRTPLILRYLGPWFPAQTPEVFGLALAGRPLVSGTSTPVTNFDQRKAAQRAVVLHKSRSLSARRRNDSNSIRGESHAGEKFVVALRLDEESGRSRSQRFPAHCAIILSGQDNDPGRRRNLAKSPLHL
jgi:hypothetical protein